MEPRTEQQLAKHLLYAAFWNAGAVVFGLQFHDVFLVVELGDFHPDVGQNTRFFAGIQRVVHGFFDGGDQRACEGIKAKEVLVFLKEFRNSHLFLVFCHPFCCACHGRSPPPVLLRLDDVGPTDDYPRP